MHSEVHLINNFHIMHSSVRKNSVQTFFKFRLCFSAKNIPKPKKDEPTRAQQIWILLRDEVVSDTNVTLWDVMLCSLVDMYKYFRGMNLHLQGRTKGRKFLQNIYRLHAITSLTLWYAFLTSIFNVVRTETEMGWPLENFVEGHGYRHGRIMILILKELSMEN